MFKQNKENAFSSQETINFFTRQLNYLTNIAKRINELMPELVADQIVECVTLIEKKIVYTYEEKSSEEFHDYVADFYENKL